MTGEEEEKFTRNQDKERERQQKFLKIIHRETDRDRETDRKEVRENDMQRNKIGGQS